MKGLFVFMFCFFTVGFALALPALNDQRIEKLPTKKIKVAGIAITVEVADTLEARERGLMYRKSMPANEGMLFVFEKAEPMSFWMKNTLIPLSIGYFGADKKLIETYEMVPTVLGEQRPKVYPSHGDVMYAIEMNKGWFAKHVPPNHGHSVKIHSFKANRHKPCYRNSLDILTLWHFEPRSKSSSHSHRSLERSSVRM